VIAISTLLVIVLVGLLITRLATAALVATGLSGESARFQARSAFTGAGFTTSEAERVVGHPVRRRVVMALMLLGNAGIATLIGGLLLGFNGAGDAAVARRMGLLVAGLLVIWTAARSRWVDRGLRRLFSRLLNRFTDLEVRDYAELLRISGDHVINELAVQPSDWICGRTLRELRLRDEGVVVLGIERSGRYLGTPRPDTVLQEGDVLLLYGHGDVIAELDSRGAGALGELAHAEQSARFEGAPNG
jgi:hypothetical protein